MHATDEHKLEGLLKARSEDMSQARRRRTPRTPVDGAAEAAVRREDGPPSAGTRPCAECRQPIDPRRLRAMPRATRCLRCQRAAEQAESHS